MNTPEISQLTITRMTTRIKAIIIDSNESEIQETETQPKIQATGSQDTEIERQSSDIDLIINEEIPVRIIID